MVGYICIPDTIVVDMLTISDMVIELVVRDVQSQFNLVIMVLMKIMDENPESCAGKF